MNRVVDTIHGVEKKYSKKIEQPLMNNMLNQTTSWCRLNPLGCGRQVITETLFIAIAFSSVIFLVGNNNPPALSDIAKFMFVFGLVNLAARMVSDSFSDKLSAAALSGLSLKIISLAAPKIISW